LRRFAPSPGPAREGTDKQASAQKDSTDEVLGGEVFLGGEVAADRATPGEIPAPPPCGPPPLELRPSLAEAERTDEPPSASVVTLAPHSARLAESRLKIGPLAFRAPAFKPAPEKPGRDDVQPAAPVPAPAAEEEPSEPALLSPASGAKIGASFEALAESLLLRDPRMIERLAREMLRPMLKEWLDNHLPDVVERLVRAEIERVARGGV
jgi:cell pole-organizing protein PopZ